MPKRTHVLAIVLIMLALLGIAPAVLAQFTPDIFAVDQPVVDNVVNVTRVTSSGPGWVVIHADADGQPGAAIGYAAIPNGISANVKVEVDPNGITDTLFAMLHVDAGEQGVYEFPDGPDLPVVLRDNVVMKSFAVSEIATTVRGLVLGDPQFSTLASALSAAGVAEAFAGDGPLTVFAPTDDAFDALPAGTLDALLADPEQLSSILLYHVVGGEALTASDLVAGELESLQGAPLSIALVDGRVAVNGAAVTQADVRAANGIVHVIDAVLLPPSEDAVPAATEAVAEEGARTIVETARSSGQFPTLVTALESAGLVDALSGEGPFTVFAPSEEAFAALPAGQLDALLADPAALADVLKYHVIAGAVASSDIVNGMDAPTLEGKPLTFAINGGLTVNGAHVIASDIPAVNGVIHVIDQVLLPPAVDERAEGAAIVATAVPAPSPTGNTIASLAGSLTNFSTLVDAAEAAGLLDDLAAPGPFTIFAPTNEAFAKLPPGALDALLADEAALQNLLLYHVILNRYTAEELASAGIETAAQGNLLVFATSGDSVRVNSIPIVEANIEASNGIVHVIDTVLTPPQRLVEQPVVVEEEPTATPEPTATHTPMPTPTPTNSPVPTPTATPTATAVPTATATDTPAPTSTNTPLPTSTATSTATNTAAPASAAPVLDQSEFEGPGRTVITGSGTPGDIIRTLINGELAGAAIVDAAGRWQMTVEIPATASSVLAVESVTLGGTVRAAAQPVTIALATPTATNTATFTPVPTATATSTPVPTSTPTNTPVPTATATSTPVPTATATSTPVPTATATNTPVPTSTPTDTPVPTATSTNTVAPTSTPLPTSTPTNTPLPPTSTPLPAPTSTPLPTATEAVVTEEAVEEATPAATEEPVEEATAVATEEAVEEATPAATEKPVEEATAVATEEAVEEATPAATEEPVEEATAVATEEPAEEATAVATEEVGEDVAAPETPEDLPSTGLDLSSGGTTLPVVALVLMVLMVGGFVTRRRSA